MKFPPKDAFVWLCGCVALFSVGLIFGMLITGNGEMISAISSFISASASVGILICAAIGLNSWNYELKYKGIRNLMEDWHHSSSASLEFHLKEASFFANELLSSIDSSSCTIKDSKKDAQECKEYLTSSYKVLIKHLALFQVPTDELSQTLNSLFLSTEKLLLDPDGINYIQTTGKVDKSKILLNSFCAQASSKALSETKKLLEAEYK